MVKGSRVLIIACGGFASRERNPYFLNMVRSVFIAVIALGIGLMANSPALAQESTSTKKEPSIGMAIGLVAHSFGFGFDVQATYLRPGANLVLDLGFSSLKHPKELKIESAYSDQGGKDYVFDKKNYAYTFAPTLGISKPIIPKSAYNKVSLNGIVSAGPLVTLLKPYYIEVAVPFSGNQAYVDVDKYTAAKYNYTNIVGEADYFLGMREITLVPGFRAKASASVDFSGSKEYIRAVELGLFMDQYLKAPELMDLTANKGTFIGGSITVLVGNTW